MATKLKKTYRFALRTSLLISLVFSILFVVFQLAQNTLNVTLTPDLLPVGLGHKLCDNPEQDRTVYLSQGKKNI